MTKFDIQVLLIVIGGFGSFFALIYLLSQAMGS